MSEIILALFPIEKRAWEEHDCPECGAAAGTPCMSSSINRRWGQYVHTSRVDAAKDAEA